MHTLPVCFSSGTSDVVCGWYEWSHTPPRYHTMALLPPSIQGESSTHSNKEDPSLKGSYNQLLMLSTKFSLTKKERNLKIQIYFMDHSPIHFLVYM